MALVAARRDHGPRHAVLDPRGPRLLALQARHLLGKSGLVRLLVLNPDEVRVALEARPDHGGTAVAPDPARQVDPEVGFRPVPRDAGGDLADLDPMAFP